MKSTLPSFVDCSKEKQISVLRKISEKLNQLATSVETGMSAYLAYKHAVEQYVALAELINAMDKKEVRNDTDKQ